MIASALSLLPAGHYAGEEEYTIRQMADSRPLGPARARPAIREPAVEGETRRRRPRNAGDPPRRWWAGASLARAIGGCGDPPGPSEGSDQTLDALVVGLERILAEDGL